MEHWEYIRCIIWSRRIRTRISSAFATIKDSIIDSRHNGSGCEMIWKKVYQLLYMFFLCHEKFFTDWNAMVILNVNRDYNCCPGTTHMSHIVHDRICSVISKTTMEPSPWTLTTYSVYVFISWTQSMWHSLYDVRCNSESLSMFCLVFTQASSVLISSVSHCRQTTVGFWFWISKPPYGVIKLTLGSIASEEYVVKEYWRAWAKLITKWFLPGVICLSRCSHTQTLK